jgi:Zn-dependent M28 family amino/carboxypeptidase
MRSDQAAAALREAGQDLGKLEARAMAGVRPPLTLDLDVRVQTTAQFRRFGSSNVIGKLEGVDRRSPGVVVFTAHWDHLGRDSTLEGDQIYNGAVDNAGGVAQLLEVARRMKQMRPGPGRTVLFIATTGEEEGQLGASYYVAHPSYPLAQTLANINLDFFLPWGRTRDVINYGPTGSTLDDIIAAAARAEGRAVTPDPTPEEGYWQRGDQYPFALAGVPSAFPAPGTHYVGRADDFGVTKNKEYTDRDYHQVSDEVRSDWDWAGAAQEVVFLTNVGNLVAADSVAPRWKDSTVCPACRDQRNHPGRP